MRTRQLVILLFFLPTIAVPALLGQTRARRVEQKASDISPSPAASANDAAAKPNRSPNDPASRKNKLPSNRGGPDDVDVVRVETTLVTVPVSVTDRLGRYMPDLQRQDFHLFEEGEEQEIAYFAAVEKPFTVVLMIDTSSSNWSKLSQIRAAAKVFVEQLRPDDQVMIVSFASGLTRECEPTSDRQKIRKAIDKTGKGLSTHLYDAMDKVMQKYLDRIQGRKAVVLFTDGVDATSSHATYEGTLRVAEELDALIYPIRYDTYDRASDTGNSTHSGSRWPSIFGIPLPTIGVGGGGGGGGGGGSGSSRADYDRGQRYLQELAELTGGRYYEANRDLRDLQAAFSHIAEELRRQYSLGYYPKQTAQTGERRRIKVRVNRPDVAVRSRDSYIIKGNTSVTGTPATTATPDKHPSSPPVLQKKPLVSGV